LLGYAGRDPLGRSVATRVCNEDGHPCNGRDHGSRSRPRKPTCRIVCTVQSVGDDLYK
jgi:hypothetical protein